MKLKRLMLMIFWIGTVTAQKKCCKGRENAVNGKKCTDGTNITGIPCDRMYLIEILDDQDFIINSNGDLVSNNDTTTISIEDYCVTTNSLNGKNVALVCLDDVSEESSDFYMLRACCAAISVMFLLLTCVVYILVPNLRDLQGKCILHSISALTLALFLLCLLQFGVTLSEKACHATGYIAFISFFSTFTWLNVVAFHIWRTTVLPSILGTERQWYFLYCIYAYGIPAIVIVAAIIAHYAPGDHIKPGIGEYSCWFATREASWSYFYGPIAFFLVMNVFFFVWTVIKLWSTTGNYNMSKLRALRFKCMLHVKLFFIMGLSWIFEVLSFGFDDDKHFIHYVWMVTDFINALQGVLIFLILVAFRKKALRGLANDSLCCIKMPSQWKALQDDECEDLVEERRLNVAPVEQVYKEKENQSLA